MRNFNPAAWLLRAAVCACLAANTVIHSATNASAQSGESDAFAEAKEYFAHACAVCHGADGKGGGVLASQLKTPPSDLTQIIRRAGGGSFPELHVYETIEGFNMPPAHGSREMPVWGAVILFEELGQSTAKGDAKIAEKQTRNRLRHLVSYLNSIQE